MVGLERLPDLVRDHRRLGMFLKPLFKMIEFYGSGLLKRAGSELPDPVVVNPQMAGQCCLLPVQGCYLLPCRLDSFLDFRQFLPLSYLTVY